VELLRRSDIGRRCGNHRTAGCGQRLEVFQHLIPEPLRVGLALRAELPNELRNDTRAQSYEIQGAIAHVRATFKCPSRTRLRRVSARACLLSINIRFTLSPSAACTCRWMSPPRPPP